MIGKVVLIVSLGITSSILEKLLLLQGKEAESKFVNVFCNCVIAPTSIYLLIDIIDQIREINK